MLGTILQLSAAFLFGYQIAIRNKDGIKKSTSVQGRVFTKDGKEVATPKTVEAYYDTNMYRIGFIYLIFGYLIPLTEFKIGDNIESSAKIFLVVFIAITLVIIGHQLSKIIASYQIKYYS